MSDLTERFVTAFEILARSSERIADAVEAVTLDGERVMRFEGAAISIAHSFAEISVSLAQISETIHLQTLQPDEEHEL